MLYTELEKFDRFDYVTEKSENKFGIIRKNGAWMILPTHDSVHIIEADIVHIGNNSRYCLTDRFGRLLREVDYDRVKRLYWLGKYYALRKDGKWAIADSDFNPITDYIFDDCKSLPADSVYVRVGEEERLLTLYDFRGSPLRCSDGFR